MEKMNMAQMKIQDRLAEMQVKISEIDGQIEVNEREIVSLQNQRDALIEEPKGSQQDVFVANPVSNPQVLEIDTQIGLLFEKSNQLEQQKSQFEEEQETLSELMEIKQNIQGKIELGKMFASVGMPIAQTLIHENIGLVAQAVGILRKLYFDVSEELMPQRTRGYEITAGLLGKRRAAYQAAGFDPKTAFILIMSSYSGFAPSAQLSHAFANAMNDGTAKKAVKEKKVAVKKHG
jgi:hypothetical protein